MENLNQGFLKFHPRRRCCGMSSLWEERNLNKNQREVPNMYRDSESTKPLPGFLWHLEQDSSLRIVLFVYTFRIFSNQFCFQSLSNRTNKNSNNTFNNDTFNNYHLLNHLCSSHCISDLFFFFEVSNPSR